MLQLPSNLAAIAGGAEQMIARALDRAKAHIRLPIMKVLMGIRLIGEAPAKGGHIGASGPVGGGPMMGEGKTHHNHRPIPAVSSEQHRSILASRPFCRPGPATVEPLWLAVRFAQRSRGNGMRPRANSGPWLTHAASAFYFCLSLETPRRVLG